MLYKLETTANGMTITGNVGCDGLTVDDNEVIALGNSSDLNLYMIVEIIM